MTLIRKSTAILMLLICVAAFWGGIYLLVTATLDRNLMFILFGLPLLGIVLVYIYLRQRIGAFVLMLPFALAYIINSFR